VEDFCHAKFIFLLSKIHLVSIVCLYYSLIQKIYMFKQKKLTVSLCLLLCLIFPLQLVHGETRINYPEYINDVIFTKAGSPYIVDGDMVMELGRTLTVEKGVEIIANASTSLPFKPFILAGGSVHILGTEEEPVKVTGLRINMSGKDNSINHAIFDKSTIHIEKGPNPAATTTITASEFMNNATSSLEIQQGNLSISGSVFHDNNIAISSTNRATWDSVSIHDSVFENNQKLNIQNQSFKSMDAQGNWWGSATGPGATVSGTVFAFPWKTEDPRIKKIECCSNVLFLPGLEASRLYSDMPIFGATTTIRMWEPVMNDNVRKLFLDGNGSSTDPTIHAKGVIDSAMGIKGIYKNFVAMMDSVVAEKQINEWVPYAYDWRFSPLDSANESLVSEIERLAKTSKTGKVTLIAHSNGGLVAKALGQALEKKGESDLIDKVVFVAVPELGTPQAAAALLHGFDQELLGGLVLKEGVARSFGLTLPGVYGLLPSADYFSRVTDSVITVADKAVGSFENFGRFLSGASDNRIQPKESDTNAPAVLSSALLGKAQLLHENLDGWHFPTGIETLSLVGWGTPTTEGIDYGTSTSRIRLSPNGDGTVIAESAAGYSADNVYFNQGLFDHDTGRDVSHASIFEANPLRSLLSNIVGTTTLAAAKNSLPEYFTTSKPKSDDYPWMKWLTVSVHSPVDLDITDSHGRHMGLVPLSAVSPEAKNSDLMWFDNTIGGNYYEFGDEKYFTVPADDVYNIKMNGTGVGTFTFQVQKFVGGDMTEVANVVYKDLPVTPLLEASTTLSSSMLSPALNLDVDGNGTVDIKAPPSPTMNPLLHLDAMKTIILSLKLKPATEKNLLLKIEKIRTLLSKGKADKAIEKIRKITGKMADAHWKQKKLTETEKTQLAGLFENLLDALDK
jgi:pimeloyl-ACP methyl ester carboxylesterase